MNFLKKSKIDYLDIAKSAIIKESEALLMLANNLPSSFNEAMSIIVNIEGRLVVSGVGKSGHIGKKIASTFASIGLPSYFVHSGEAGHGDLGMITKQDVVLIISRSGESSELLNVVSYSRRYGIKVILITFNAESSLAKLSNVVICLPEMGEICPMGLAPTTSTTMTLALGDAIAVSFLSSKTFTKNDFGVFHPKGRLGAQLQITKDIMNKFPNIPLVNDVDSMKSTLLVITSKGFGCVGVTDQHGILCGVITDGDLRRNMNDDFLKKNANEIMTKNPITISPSSLLVDVLKIMEDNSITSVFVVDEMFKPVGIVNIHDCLRIGAL